MRTVRQADFWHADKVEPQHVDYLYEGIICQSFIARY